MHTGRTSPHRAGVLTHPALSVVLDRTDRTHYRLLAGGPLIQQHFMLHHLFGQLLVIAARTDKPHERDTVTAGKALEPVLSVGRRGGTPDDECNHDQDSDENQDTHSDQPNIIMRKG